MKISSLFRFDSLAPAWQFSAEHTLWRMMFSNNGFIVGEDRNIQQKTTTFFCINARDGSVMWRGKNFDEQWWIGIEGIFNDRLFLHGFRKPDMPDHQGILCIDLNSGNELWRNPSYAFLTADGPSVYGYRDMFERKVYYELRGADGSVLNELEELPAGVAQNSALGKTDFIFPQPVQQSDESVWKLLRDVIHIEMPSVRLAEFIETENNLLLNIYCPQPSTDALSGENLTNTLYIIDAQKKQKKFSDVLNKETPYPVPDSFFVDNDMLYYIKERKTFVALNLNQ